MQERQNNAERAVASSLSVASTASAHLAALALQLIRKRAIFAMALTEGLIQRNNDLSGGHARSTCLRGSRVALILHPPTIAHLHSQQVSQ